MDRTTYSARRGPARGPRSLPEQLFLLACDLEKERLRGTDRLGYVLRAAALVDLTEHGCLIDEDGKAKPVGDRRSGDPVLDEVLRGVVAQKRPKKWKALVQRERRQTLQAVQQRLSDAGEIKVEKHTWRGDRIVVKDRSQAEQLRGAALGPLDDKRPVRDIDPRDAALTALAVTGQLPIGLSGKERRKHKKRIAALAERAGDAGPALKKAMDAAQAAMIAAMSGAAASSGGG